MWSRFLKLSGQRAGVAILEEEEWNSGAILASECRNSEAVAGCDSRAIAKCNSGAVSGSVAWIVAGSDARTFCPNVVIPGLLLGALLGLIGESLLDVVPGLSLTPLLGLDCCWV